MTWERYEALVRDLCVEVGLPDPEHVLDTRAIEVEGFDVRIDHLEKDPDAVYVNFQYGTVTAGRTLIIFKLMLEANLLIYAQDQAQLGLDSDTGGIVLIVRLPFEPNLTAAFVADLLLHYADHGRYWRQNILESNDEMFDGLASGEYTWLRA